MFTLRRPTPPEIETSLAHAVELPRNYPISLNTQDGPESVYIPPGYVRDHTRSQIGEGLAAFESAKAAFKRWQQFDLGWTRVANPETIIEPGETVAVEAHALGLWSINFSQILYIIDSKESFGFGYGTSTHHIERGEERFLIEYYPKSDVVYYELLAVSQPAHWLARLGYPVTRFYQHKFARDSHRKMKQICRELSPKRAY